MLKNIFISIRLLSIVTILLGFIYPLFITGVSQLFFYKQANGSIIKEKNNMIGSELIGQKFSSPKYFWGRPSASDYGTIPSGASNLGFTSADLKKNIEDRKKVFGGKKDIPNDLLFASGSGIDPDISPEAVIFQLERVAKSRNFNENQIMELRQLVEKSIVKRQFGILGEDRVNVLKLNLEVDKIL